MGEAATTQTLGKRWQVQHVCALQDACVQHEAAQKGHVRRQVQDGARGQALAAEVKRSHVRHSACQGGKADAGRQERERAREPGWHAPHQRQLDGLAAAERGALRPRWNVQGPQQPHLLVHRCSPGDTGCTQRLDIAGVQQLQQLAHNVRGWRVTTSRGAVDAHGLHGG